MAYTSIIACILLVGAATVSAGPLDDYLERPEPAYKWFDTGVKIDTVFGGVGHVLNVTSQTWLDVSKAYGPNGALWTHQVIVVVPKHIRNKTMGMAYITGGCNENPSVPSKTDEELLLIDTITAQSGIIGIIVYQIPNCHMHYPSDPTHAGRSEDAMIAWAWHEYLVRPDHDPEWLPRLPMAKGAMQSMKAAASFLKGKENLEIDGWVVSGASKRGWTTWMVGAATCSSCVNIVAIAPLVPIVPNLRQEMHRMWQAYDGWTFAFSDYTAVNLTTHVDDPTFGSALKIIDPMYYLDRLARLPKVVVLSSDDEFMMMDWSNIWYDELKGEKHLLIAPDSEHSLATGIPEVVETLSALVDSISQGEEKRPNFQYTFENKTGALTVELDAFDAEFAEVYLVHAENFNSHRRDFRWVRLANNVTGECKLPEVKLPKPLFGGNCLVPIIWHKTQLKPVKAGSHAYTGTPPEPTEGRYTGYYIEVLYKNTAKEPVETKYHFTTPGYTRPNTLPFPDCHGKTCVGRLL